ncbi:MAG: phosphoribosylaminoimidazolesuccinocarboxamide synthase [Bacteroidia bacterium]|nr:phosphoribosylaminoimidazolesuccinocarboxamide synthase [Bacteroidia bacterium]MCZ2277013.1 phosphoribosylaminoimidazolesuccinocarboxamide synthase [Bacteroidia bacterium]
MSAISKTNFQFQDQTKLYHGKVRDVYHIGDDLLVIIVTDRISAFDVILPRPIPYKGQVLNQIAAYFMEATSDLVPNWIVAVPDPNVTIGKKCTPFKVEMVIRGYLSGHAWRVYKAGNRELCGVKLPEGLKESGRLPQPIITPTTKATAGHDEDISKEELIKQGIVSKKDYDLLEEYTYSLFKRGTELASLQGLILVDTKYEFGKDKNGNIVLIDEIHTPDSSRYFYQDGYETRQKSGEPQKQLSKEFLRQWLIENNFTGQAGQTVPDMEDDMIAMVSERYIELFEKVTGQKFTPDRSADPVERIEKAVQNWLRKNRS